MSKPIVREFTRWRDKWAQFTPAMKATFRAIARNGKRQRRHIAPATLTALRRHHVVMEWNSDTGVKVYFNADGCELLDWLRFTRQVTKDRK